MPFNAALVPLIALAAAGLFLRDRGLKIAWLAVAAAGAGLLLTALALPAGIPSPAATLGAYPPWQGELDPARGNPALRDVTFQVQPWLLYLRTELRSGRLPFWNPYQSSGTPYWANGSSAPLFPLHLLFVALPLRVGFVLLPWLRFLVAGLGAWAFGRRLGLSSQGATMAAVAFPLSGMLVSFLLFPMGSALALVPWVLWAVDRMASEGKGWTCFAALAALQLLAGHPETSVHTALLTAVYLGVRGTENPLRTWIRLGAGWMVAAIVAAIHLLPLALFLTETSRWLALAHTGPPPSLSLLLVQPLRLVLPQLYGHPAEGTWWGPFNYSATAVYVGIATLALAVSGAARARRDRRWLALLVLGGLSFLAAYHLPGVHHLMAALPIVGRAAHHRLIFGIELTLSLLAGAGLERWREGQRRGVALGAGAIVALLAVAWLLHLDAWRERDLVGGQIVWTAWAALAATGLVASCFLPRTARSTLWGAVPVLSVLDLLVAHGGINPALSLDKLYPETSAVQYLQGRSGRVAGLGGALHPNAGMVYGIHDVRGDDSLEFAHYERVYSQFAPHHPTYFQPIHDWQDPWLDQLGVRWVVAGPEEASPVPGWELAYAGQDARVYERSAALGMVRWKTDPAGTGISIQHRRPGTWFLGLSRPDGGELIVAEAWDRGWQATADGHPIPVERENGVLIRLPIPTGTSRVELSYIPPGFELGAGLSALGIAVLAAARRSWR